MKKLFVFIALILPNLLINAQNPGDNVFSGVNVYSIKIDFSQPNYWDTLTYYYNLGTEEYIPADITIDGVAYPNCGIRFKGNSSFNHPNNKKSLKIAFDEYNSSQRWDGMKSIHLNNVYGDPTFMREKIILDFCQNAGIVAPRANYASVYINDTLFAFYSLIENVDKKFLGTRYGNSTGDLFKAVDGFDNSSLVSDFKWYTAVADSYYTRYELKTDGSITAWTQLLSLLDSVNNSTTTLNAYEDKINLNALYSSIAADIIFSNLDSYNGSGRNFYFYFNPETNKMEWIKWDVGLGFGLYNSGVSNYETLNLLYLINTNNRPLLGKILSNPSLKQEYLETICNLNKNYFTISDLYAKIDEIANTIRPYVYGDLRKQYTNAQFELNINSDLTITSVGGTSKIPGLKSFINARKNSINSQLSSLGITCNTSINYHDLVINEFMADNDTILDPANETDDWIELYNNTDNIIDLSGLYLSDSFTSPTKWSFPEGTTITGKSYLIVWADENLTQEGIHANFKLSASGEKIILSNIDNSVIDSVSFSAQTTNLSMARHPNGTGTFSFGLPTFKANNDEIVSVDELSLKNYDFGLNQNYPNPFNPSTNISFSIPNTGLVTLKVYDVLGREVLDLLNDNISAGNHSILFNASNLSSGIYIYRLTYGDLSISKCMMLLK